MNLISKYHDEIAKLKAKNITLQLNRDILNLVGLTIQDRTNLYSYYYKYSVKEVVDDSICEFTRPTGGFKRVFPTLNNIDKYKKFLTRTPENELLWKVMKKFKIR